MGDLDQCVDSFTSTVVDVMNSVLPEKLLRVKTNSSPWIQEPEVHEARLKRDLAHRKALKHRTDEAWKKYKTLRNKATSQIRTAKASYFQHLAKEIQTKPQRFWKEFRHLSSKSKKSAMLPSHIF